MYGKMQFMFETTNQYRMVPPSDVCWFIIPMNTIYLIYHKP